MDNLHGFIIFHNNEVWLLFLILFQSFLDALKESLGLQLVGPYDVLSGSFDDVKESDIISYHLHYRYYYDPPEFLTVIKGDDKTGFHVGYYR